MFALQLLQLEDLLLPKFCGAPVPPRLYSLHIDSILEAQEQKLRRQRSRSSKGDATQTSQANQGAKGTTVPSSTGTSSKNNSGTGAARVGRPGLGPEGVTQSNTLPSTSSLVSKGGDEEEEENEGGARLRLSPLQLLVRGALISQWRLYPGRELAMP
jgi:hypothetical protein